MLHESTSLQARQVALLRAIAFAFRGHRKGAKNTKGFAKKFKTAAILLLCTSFGRLCIPFGHLCVPFASLRLCGGRLGFRSDL